MRIASIDLSWFRGASDPVSLDLDGKSAVVYGVNGAGKSSFVDAVEYVLNKGRIGHLAHEDSGKRQENAVPNTHTPEGRHSVLKFKLGGGKSISELLVEIKRDGTSTKTGDTTAMADWDYGRTVLRQDEVSNFIRGTKGEKYSALLPLLGLHDLEVAAENLRQLAKTVEERSKIAESKIAIRAIEPKRKATFGTDSDGQILKRIEKLYATYCVGKFNTQEVQRCCTEIEIALNNRIERFSSDQKRQLVLQEIAELDLKHQVGAVRAASSKLAETAEPLIAEKLSVLQSATDFVRNLPNVVEVDCPACGQHIPVEALRAHVEAEHKRLQEVIGTFESRNLMIGALCDNLQLFKSNLIKPAVKSWRDELAKGEFADSVTYLEGLKTDTLRTSCGENELIEIEDRLLPLVGVAGSAANIASPDVQQMSTDKRVVETAQSVMAALQRSALASRAEDLVRFVNALENGVRQEIRARSTTIIKVISDDIRAMWTILHPGDGVDGVRLYLPKAADKSIDIGLKFHDIEQDSPRLTLSEGYRNSLGLCIFLAMAKRDTGRDRPMFLDDVVVSLDREHRGMIVEVLKKHFDLRQVVILTHDREWYTELRQQLDEKHWIFKALLPYDAPKVGIRWSHKTTTFDDARAQLKDRPDSAGNDVRKIMDIEVAVIAERLRIRLPYLRAEKNDRRMAHEFLEQLIADGANCLQTKEGKDYSPHTVAIKALEEADRLLVTWANHASHTFDLVRPEAVKLIDTCEKALEHLKCSSCGKGVWFANASGTESVQCHCGKIRWRYGKG